MSFETRSLVLVLCASILVSAEGRGEDITPYAGPACARDGDDYFAREVWDNVGALRCVQCHKPGSEAEESELILQDPRKLQGHARDDAMRHNRDAFARLARMKEGDRSRLLVKA